MRRIVSLALVFLVLLRFPALVCADTGQAEQWIVDEETNGADTPTLSSAAVQLPGAALCGPDVIQAEQGSVSGLDRLYKPIPHPAAVRLPVGSNPGHSQLPPVFQQNSRKKRIAVNLAAGGVMLVGFLLLASSGEKSKGRIAAGIAVVGAGAVIIAWGEHK